MFAHIYTGDIWIIDVAWFIWCMCLTYMIQWHIFISYMIFIYIHIYIYRYLTNDILYVYILYILIPSKPHDFEATRKPQKREAAERVQILSPGESGQYFRTKIRQTAGFTFWGKENLGAENWGRFPFWLIFLKGVETTTKRPWLWVQNVFLFRGGKFCGLSTSPGIGSPMTDFLTFLWTRNSQPLDLHFATIKGDKAARYSELTGPFEVWISKWC